MGMGHWALHRNGICEYTLDLGPVMLNCQCISGRFQSFSQYAYFLRRGVVSRVSVISFIETRLGQLRACGEYSISVRDLYSLRLIFASIYYMHVQGSFSSKSSSTRSSLIEDASIS